MGNVRKSSLHRGLAFGGWLRSFGVTIDKISTLVGLAFSLVGFLIVVYSAGYMSAENREHPEYEVKKRYYFFLLTFIGAMAGLVFSSTMIGLLVFFELTGVCSWGLIGYYDDEKARKSAMKAIVTTQVASLGLYIATVIFFGLTGTFNLSAFAGVAANAKIILFICILIAAWGKSAQLPFHFWLPDAMVAPTPISAYLHAASMVNAGVYIFARCLVSAGSVPTVVGIIGAIMAMITMLYGFFMYFPAKGFEETARVFDHHTIVLCFPGPFHLHLRLEHGLQWCHSAYLQQFLWQEFILPGGGRSQLFGRNERCCLP